jgi:hypothetical protein
MSIRDRVKELRRVKASELRPHPRNWRLHPPAQHDALRGILAEVGFAGALLVRELDDGALQIIDGHLRAEATPSELVPVLVLDVDAAEAELLLATYDAVGGLAQPDFSQLSALITDCDFQNPALAAMFSELLAAQERPPPPEDSASPRDRSGELADSFQVVATCRDEADQQALFERLSGAGYRCRLLML